MVGGEGFGTLEGADGTQVEELDKESDVTFDGNGDGNGVFAALDGDDKTDADDIVVDEDDDASFVDSISSSPPPWSSNTRNM